MLVNIDHNDFGKDIVTLKQHNSLSDVNSDSWQICKTIEFYRLMEVKNHLV